MKFKVLTLFPEFFDCFIDFSIIGRARSRGLISIETINIRDYSLNKHHKVDDYPYGGGQGMVMACEPIVRCLEDIDADYKKIYLSPQGRMFNQEMAKTLSKEEGLILLCGHYEGIDQRIIDNFIDEEISIGDYVLTGGETGAMVMIEAISRLIPEVLSSEEAFLEESHSFGMLEYPQYTRPENFRGKIVPEVLLSGNHKEIEKWRLEKAIENTKNKRPDLWARFREKGGLYEYNKTD